MDLEKSLFSHKITGYEIHETSQYLTFEIECRMLIDDVVLEYSEEDNSICLSVNHSDIVYGCLYAPITDPKYEVVHNKVKVTMTKVADEDWPILMSGPSKRGIDPKSEFMLGAFSDASGNYEKAWIHFKNAADNGHDYAQAIVAEAYLTPENPYNIEPNMDECIKAFRRVYDQQHDPGTAMTLADLLNNSGKPEEACRLLRDFLVISPDMNVEYRLAKILYEDNKLAEAIPLLEELVQKKHPRAMYLLSDCLKKGLGIAKDEKRAKELRAAADKISGVEVESDKNIIAMAVAASTAVVLAGVCVFRLLRRKSHISRS